MNDKSKPRRGADFFLPLIGILAVACMALATSAGPQAATAAPMSASAETGAPMTDAWVFP